jgi:hypothetical protein
MNTMTATWKFRILSSLIFAFVACIAVANLMADFSRLPPAKLRSSAELSPDELSSAHLASAIAPFRSDLAADYAIALATPVLSAARSSQPDAENAALGIARYALKIGPHDSRLWLLLAQLQAHRNPNDPQIAEALKMSYLTGPNRADLIPVRLENVTSNNALSDSDLSELARGDVRAILTHLPDQRSTLARDYAHASDTGKAFLKESVGALDPKFVDALQAAK